MAPGPTAPGQRLPGRHSVGWMTLCLALFALGAVGASARQKPAPTPPRDCLVVALAGEPRSLDPHVTTALSDFRVVAGIYEGLVRYRSGSLEVEPALAERYEVSDDGSRYRFELREGVRFHDGTPFDAGAVRFNLERLIDPNHPHRDTGPFPLAFLLDRIARVKVLDRLSVELTLDEPFAPLLANLAQPIGFMLSPAAVARFGKQVGRHPSGTGPYRFESWAPEQAIELRAVENHHGRKAHTGRVIFRPIVDPMTRLLELRAGGVDVVPEVMPDALRFFRSNRDYTVLEQTGPHLWFLILNTRTEPFSDVRMRRAVNFAVDKRRLTERVLEGTADVAAGPIPRAFAWAHDPALAPYPYDVERAKALIAEAGYAGKKLRLLAPSSGSGMLAPLEMATAIQADLRAVGLDVAIEIYEWSAYLAKVNAGLDAKSDMAEMAWMTHDPDTLPFLTLRSAARPPEGFNSGYYRSDEVDALLERARRTADTAQRAALYRRIARLVQSDAPWLFVASWKQNVVTRASVTGIALEPSFFLQLDRAYKR